MNRRHLPGISLLLCLSLAAALPAFSQSKFISLGIFSGINSTYTWDEGINKDQRYKARYDLKPALIGINYSIDTERYGIDLSPGLFNTGQNFLVINTVGGQEGTRKINQQYLNVPVVLKLHLIDLSFLQTSFEIGGSAAYLLKGSETITHNSAKFRFPTQVYPLLPEDYIVQYDGVLSPRVSNLTILEKKDFNALQLMGTVGLRSDFYFSENYKLSFDFRAYYGFLDSRSDVYLKKLEANETLYDIPGRRRDITGHFSVGIARYIEIDHKETQRKRTIKESPKRKAPVKYPWPGPRNRKPKS